MFSCEFCKISKNILSYRIPPVVALTHLIYEIQYKCKATAIILASCASRGSHEPSLMPCVIWSFSCVMFKLFIVNAKEETTGNMGSRLEYAIYNVL